MWALGKMCQSPGWKGGITEEDTQQLLGQEQLQVISASGTPQNTANMLLGLTDMSVAASPILSKAVAQRCGKRLLAGSAQTFATGSNQDICNTLWACGELGLADESLLERAAAAAPRWAQTCQNSALAQAALACLKLQYAHQGFMAALLQRGQQLLESKGRHGKQRGSRPAQGLGRNDRGTIASRLPFAVVPLDMQQLAPQARQLVASSGKRQLPQAHPADLRRLWVFHSWLLQHQLLDGRGLTGLLTQQQLQQGQQEAALHPDFL